MHFILHYEGGMWLKTLKEQYLGYLSSPKADWYYQSKLKRQNKDMKDENYNKL